MRSSQPWFVYLLRCCDGSLYCGVTNDLEGRIRTHESGKGARYTRARTPVVLVYSEESPSRSEALRRERAIKRLRRDAKLALIRELPGRSG